MEFDRRKGVEMSAHSSPSFPNGNLDSTIYPLLDAINRYDSYFSITGSSSSRITILYVNRDAKRIEVEGRMVLMEYGTVDSHAVLESVISQERETSEAGDLVFRFEPLIVVVECRDITSANELVSMAIRCGFRESGITNLQKPIEIAIRCSIRLEVPLGDNNQIRVPVQYIRYIVQIANEKMEANRKRTEAFLKLLNYQILMKSISINADNFQGIVGDSNRKYNNDNFGVNPEIIPKCDRRYETEYYNTSCNITKLEDNNENDSTTKSKKDFQAGSYREKGNDYHVSLMKIDILGQPMEKLFLWGLSTCAFNRENTNKILIFGGFGGAGRHARRNDSLVFDLHSGILKNIHPKYSPSPRLGHTCSLVGDRFYLIGGRTGPTEILNDVWEMDLIENSWKSLQCTGNIFMARHRHAAAVVGSNIYVFGGLNGDIIYSSMHILNTESLQWYEVSIQGEWPSPRHSHCLVARDSNLFMFGGYDGDKALGDLYSFDIQTLLWKKEKSKGRTPFSRFSHSMFVYQNYLGVLGGCPLQQGCHEISLFDLINRVWKHVIIGSINKELMIRSSATVVNDDLVILGGGVSCFAFGSKFDPPTKICLLSVVASISNLKSYQPIIPCNNTSEIMDDDGYGCHLAEGNGQKSQNLKPVQMMLQLERNYTKCGKDILKKFGWLDLRRKVESNHDNAFICLPVTQGFVEQRTVYLARKSDIVDVSDIVGSLTAKGFVMKEISHLKAIAVLSECGGTVVIDNNLNVKNIPRSPKILMRDAICTLIDKNRIPKQFLEQLPTRWERLGDIVILPVLSFKDQIWDSIAKELWPAVAKALGTHRLARQGRVSSTGTRDSTLEMLVGDNSWVNHRENGITYSFDATKCMFSSGNLSEKLRMSRLDCTNEIVVDLFAGIGYFSLPFLVNSKAKLLYACEWNPHAMEALRYNILINDVADRCVTCEGDNRITAPKGIADRVCLGLLPTSEGSWLTAIQALKSEGGILHVHENVNDSEEERWSEYVVKSIYELAKSEGHCWDVSLEHLERVKWYGPHIRHLVADIKCKER